MATKKKAPSFQGFVLFGGVTNPFCSSKFIGFMEKQSFYLGTGGREGELRFVSDNAGYWIDVVRDSHIAPSKWFLKETGCTIAEGRGAQDLAQWLLDHPDME